MICQQICLFGQKAPTSIGPVRSCLGGMATGAEGLNVHAQELRALLALYKFGGVTEDLSVASQEVPSEKASIKRE